MDCVLSHAAPHLACSAQQSDLKDGFAMRLARALPEALLLVMHLEQSGSMKPRSALHTWLYLCHTPACMIASSAVPSGVCTWRSCSGGCWGLMSGAGSSASECCCMPVEPPPAAQYLPNHMLTYNMHILACRLAKQELARGCTGKDGELWVERGMQRSKANVK